jgi:hypothetical protein
MTDGGRWLSYSELAGERGISRQSAVRLVRRQWRRQMGNDGEARVFVPADHLPGVTPPDNGTGHDPGHDTGLLARGLAALEDAGRGGCASSCGPRIPEQIRNGSVRTTCASGSMRCKSSLRYKRRRQPTPGLIESSETRSGAEAGRDAERARADALRDRIEALQEQLAARQEVIDAAEATRRAGGGGKDERRAMNRWARLRAAWRGA